MFASPARAVVCRAVTSSVGTGARRFISPQSHSISVRVRGKRSRHQEAFALPAAAATVAFAAATVAAVLRTLLAPRTRRVVTASLLRARRTIVSHFPTSQAAKLAGAGTGIGVLPEFAARLDAVAASATADLNAVGPIDYEQLSGIERAQLLTDALRNAALADTPTPSPTAAPPPIQASAVEKTPFRLDPRARWEAAAAYWRTAESLNGRLAAIGFAVCLLRESLEPAHPSMLAQLREVIVPVATKAPPFLVAMVDRIADFLT